MGDIGVPESYDAWIALSAPPTQQTRLVRSLKVGSIKWQRIMNDVSAAEVTVARTTLRAGESFFYPTPWKHSLLIFRNGRQVWSGPVMSWSRNGDGDLVISARDAAVDLQKQYIGASRNYVDEEVSQVLLAILADANVGVAGVAPVPLTIGATYPLAFYPNSSATDLAGVVVPRVDALVTLQTDVNRFERVSTVINQLASDGLVFYTCANDYLYLNEIGVRQQLAVGDTGWPDLTDENVIGIPTVNLDGLDMTTRAVTTTTAFDRQYSGYASWFQQISNFFDASMPFIQRDATSTFDFVEGEYAYPIDNAGSGFNPAFQNPGDYLGSVRLELVADNFPADATTQGDRRQRAMFASTGAPSTTVERVQLSPGFSHPSLADDLSNLLPGCRFRIALSDRSMFDHPITERKLGIVPGYWRAEVTYGISGGPGFIPAEHLTPWVFYPTDPGILADAMRNFDWGMGAFWASRIDHLKLVQLDVEVTVDSNGGVSEGVFASFTPTIQYILKARSSSESVSVHDQFNGTEYIVTLPNRPRFVG